MAAGLVGRRGEKALFQRAMSSSQLRGQNDVLVFLTKRQGPNSMAMSFCGRLVVSRFQKVLLGVVLSVNCTCSFFDSKGRICGRSPV